MLLNPIKREAPGRDEPTGRLLYPPVKKEVQTAGKDGPVRRTLLSDLGAHSGFLWAFCFRTGAI